MSDSLNDIQEKTDFISIMYLKLYTFIVCVRCIILLFLKELYNFECVARLCKDVIIPYIQPL